MNSTWYPEIEEPIKSREKHYSLVLYILNCDICVPFSRGILSASVSSAMVVTVYDSLYNMLDEYNDSILTKLLFLFLSII